MTDLVGHFLIFTVVAVLALLVPLWIGMLVRPTLPTKEKNAIYECGEPTIGSSYVQFDLRYYTVALLFIIFDVEVVFFFPWAMVYGEAMKLADQRLESSDRTAMTERLLSQPAGSLAADQAIAAGTALKLGWTALIDVLFFFGVLLVGFAYVWKRGDLDWVRAVAHQPKTARPQVPLTHTPARTAVG
jgi:NADH-quinone oxidoreductase subunit A